MPSFSCLKQYPSKRRIFIPFCVLIIIIAEVLVDAVAEEVDDAVAEEVDDAVAEEVDDAVTEEVDGVAEDGAVIKGDIGSQGRRKSGTSAT